MAGSPVRHRYPGVRSFQDNAIDRQLFRGRDRETRELFHLVLAEQLVVVYGHSGVGKTSLIQAGLLHSLRGRGFLPVPVRFNEEGCDPRAVIFEAVRHSAVEGGHEFGSADTTTLWHFFKTAEVWDGDRLLTPLLLFDQFEEFFTRVEPEERQRFMEQFGDLVRGTRPREATIGGRDEPPLSESAPEVKIVVSLLEVALGRLEAFTPWVPQILGCRFQVRPLDAAGAVRAIREPATAEIADLDVPPIDFTEETVEKVVAFLSNRHAGADAVVGGEEVEPFQLQLVCQRIEAIAIERAREGGADRVTIAYDDLGGDDGIDHILVAFYQSVLDRLAERYNRERLQRLCEEGLINENGERIFVQGIVLARHFELPEQVLRDLAQERLVRSENRRGNLYFELSHDTLVRPILEAREQREAQHREQCARQGQERARRRVRRRAVAGVLAVFFVVAAGWQWNAHERRRLERQQEVELQRHYVRKGREELLYGSPRRAATFLTHAVKRARNPIRTFLLGRAIAQAIPRSAVLLQGEADRFDEMANVALGALLPEEGFAAVVPELARDRVDIWDVDAGKLAYSVPVRPRTITARRGKIGVIEEDGLLYVFDPVAWRDGPSDVRPLPVGEASTIALDPRNGGAIASGNTGDLFVCDARRCHKTELGFPVSALHVGDDGTRFVAFAAGRYSTLVQGGTHGQLRLRGGDKPVVSIASRGRRVALGTLDGSILLFELPTELDTRWECRTSWRVCQSLKGRRIDGHRLPVRALAFDANGDRLLSASDDRTTRVWNVDDGTVVSEYVGHDDGVLTAAFAANDSATVLTLGRDAMLNRWDVAARPTEIDLGAEILAHARSSDGSVWVVGTGAPRPALHAITDAVHRPAVESFAQETAVTAVAISGTGDRIASADASGNVWMQQRVGDRWRRPVRLFALGIRVNSVRFHPKDDRLLLTAGDDGHIALWNWGTQERVAVWQHATVDPFGEATGVRAVFSGQGDRLVSVGRDHVARVWRMESGRQPIPEYALSDHVAPVVDAIFSRDGKGLVTASEDQTAKLWDLDSGELVATMRGHTGAIRSVAISADDRMIVTASDDGSVRIWGGGEGLPLAELRPHPGPIVAAANPADSQQLVSLGRRGILRFAEFPDPLPDIEVIEKRLACFVPWTIEGNAKVLRRSTPHPEACSAAGW